MRKIVGTITAYQHRGRLTCNIWWSLTGGGAVKLSEDDLEALHALRRK